MRPRKAPMTMLGHAIAALAAFGLFVSVGCQTEQAPSYQGYAEGEYIHVAAPTGGRLMSLPVSRGNMVQKGDPLFALESEKQRDQVLEAEKLLAQARSELEDLKKGRRQTEIEALEARLAQAETALAFSRKEYSRRVDLASTQAISEDEVDRAETSLEKDRQEVRRLQAELATARLGARPDRIDAARARVQSTQAVLEQMRWELQERSQEAPTRGVVFDTFYEAGEWVNAGQPVVSLLPPKNMKVVFFVPETEYGNISLGDRVLVTWDGGGELRAQVSFISPEPEYTPPVIYSSSSRAKLVFLLEARPLNRDSVLSLHPGQPVEVRLLQSGGSRG